MIEDYTEPLDDCETPFFAKYDREEKIYELLKEFSRDKKIRDLLDE